MSTICLEHFRCKVVWCATNSTLLLTLVENLCGKAKVTDLEAHSVSEEQVSELKVAMDDLTRVHILHREDKLVDVISCLNFMQSLSTLDQVGERLVRADVKHDVDILLVLKVAIKANNVLMVERSVDFDLTS